MVVFLPSLLFVTLAEMGDKTQLLAMAFATRFPARIVLSAVFVATLLNHALAVAAGRLLTNVIPLEAISLAAALSFILFGLWTLRGDTLEGEDQQQSSYGPFLTVAVAFFLAELGDKTQLATISLAVRYSDSLAVLLGTTTGMVVADSIGIGIGIVLGQRLPDALIRLVSAGVFIFFGLAGASGVLTTWLPLAVSSAALFALAVATLGAWYDGATLFLSRIGYRRDVAEGEVLDAFDEEVAKVAREGVPGPELARVKTKVLADWYAGLEPRLGLAVEAAYVGNYGYNIEINRKLPRYPELIDHLRPLRRHETEQILRQYPLCFERCSSVRLAGFMIEVAGQIAFDAV